MSNTGDFSLVRFRVSVDVCEPGDVHVMGYPLTQHIEQEADALEALEAARRAYPHAYLTRHTSYIDDQPHAIVLQFPAVERTVAHQR